MDVTGWAALLAPGTAPISRSGCPASRRSSSPPAYPLAPATATLVPMCGLLLPEEVCSMMHEYAIALGPGGRSATATKVSTQRRRDREAAAGEDEPALACAGHRGGRAGLPEPDGVFQRSGARVPGGRRHRLLLRHHAHGRERARHHP